MVQRLVQEEGGSVPSNVDPQVFINRTHIQAITWSGRERRKGGYPDKNVSQLSNRLCTLLSSESIHRKSGSHVYKKAPRTDRNWSPCWHDAEKPRFGKTPGTLVTDGEPHATALSRGSRTRTLVTVCCAMRCQDAATADTTRSNRCFDSNASRTEGGRRLCWWRRWLALNGHYRNLRNGQCRWARAGIPARPRNRSRAPFERNRKSLSVSNLIEAI